MTEFEILVTQELSEIKSLATKAASAAEAANDAAVAATSAMSDRLFHPQSGVIATLQGDITEIKDDRKRDEKWEKIHRTIHYATAPLLVTAHSIARHFGINI